MEEQETQRADNKQPTSGPKTDRPGNLSTLSKKRYSRSVKTVEIKLSIPTMPSLPRSKQAFKKASQLPVQYPKRSILVGALIIVALSGYYSLSRHTPSAAEKAKLHGTVAQIMNGKPDYPTVLPAGKRIEDLGGWARVSPPDRNPVFAYLDKIGNVPINVSEQPLPDDFVTDTEQQMEQLASGYKANEKITVGDTVVHIGTSAKGPQSAIFNKGKTLILIKSAIKVDTAQWSSYVSSLE